MRKAKIDRKPTVAERDELTKSLSQFAMATLVEYAKQNAFPIRPMDDLSPMEQWLIKWAYSWAQYHFQKQSNIIIPEGLIS